MKLEKAVKRQPFLFYVSKLYTNTTHPDCYRNMHFTYKYSLKIKWIILSEKMLKRTSIQYPN
jgi:hypothetical protein